MYIDEVIWENTKIPYESFCKLREDNPNLNIEYVDDHIRIIAPENPVHNVIGGRVFLILTSILEGQKYEAIKGGQSFRFTKGRDVGCIGNGIGRPFKVYIPDASVIYSKEYDGMDYVGTPNLVVEILSKSTKDIDFGEKLKTYSLNGIENYWIIDPRDKTVVINTNLAVVRELNDIKEYEYCSITLGEGGSFGYKGTSIVITDFFEGVDEEQRLYWYSF